MKNNPVRLTLCLAATLVVAASAWGFAYTINSSTGLPVKWPEAVFPFRTKLGTLNGIDQNANAQSAAAVWNAIMGSTRIDVTIGTGGAGEGNRENEMIFAPNVFGAAFDTNVLAVTTSFRRGNERTEADIIFNSNRTWGSYNGALQQNVTDLRRVAIHELGHALGLSHPDEAQPPQTFQPPLPIMNSRISSNEALIPDDITGAQNLYGPPGTPPNDNFASAATITLTAGHTAIVTGHTNNATKQAGEPNHAGNAGGHSIWWRWTAPAPGPVTLDTRGSYSDTTLGVYTGTAVNALIEVASDDDIQDGVVQASQLSFTAVIGITYFIAIDGFAGDMAGVTLSMGFTPSAVTPPAITTQPVSQTVTAGNAASFSVVATNAANFQWVFNGNSIGGATTSTFNIGNAQSGNAGNYFVAVSNAAGTVNSSTVTLTVNVAPPATGPNPTPPSGGGGGGGGGAPTLWFYGAVSLMALARFLRRR